MAIILNSDRVNRIHRARDDSGQNEAKRSNACIGEALVNGGPLMCKYFDAHKMINMPEKEFGKLPLEDILKAEVKAMEEYAWEVSKDVRERINHEPGPAGDFMLSFLTPKKDEQCFFNTEELRQYVGKQKDIPGFAYFEKINSFIQDHIQVGELYLEFIKEDCKKENNSLCDFCTKFPNVTGLKRVPKPLPDTTALPKLQYLPCHTTPTVLYGKHQAVDDFQPRAQHKKSFNDKSISSNDPELILKFSNKIW